MLSSADILITLCREYNIRYKCSSKEITMCCPFHDDHKPSFSYCIDPEDERCDLWNCFTCGASGRGVNRIITKVAGDAKAWLKEHDCWEEPEINYNMYDDMNPYFDSPVKYREKQSRANWQYQDESVLKDWCEWYHPYLERRGISMETAKRFHLGYDDTDKTVVFPVYDINKKLITYTKRSILDKTFKLEHGIRKPIYLLNEVFNKQPDTIYVCESQINALTLWQWGYPAIAMIGSPCISQYDYLSHVVGWPVEYVLCFDADDAGDKFDNKFREYFKWSKNPVSIRSIEIPSVPGKSGKDINDLTLEEFRRLDNPISKSTSIWSDLDYIYEEIKAPEAPIKPIKKEICLF